MLKSRIIRVRSLQTPGENHGLSHRLYSTVTVPLPSEQTVQQMMGESYDPERPSLFLNGCRVPLETTDKVGTRTSPLG
jgi:hypothetical protein